MRLKIFFALVFLALIGSTYAASLLPFITDNTFYKDYVIGYMPLIQKGLSILMIVVVAYVASMASDLVLLRFFTPVLRSNTLARKVFPLIHWALTIAIWIVAVFFVLGTLGINIAALVTGAGVGGVLFALASKEFIANLFGSLSLIFSKNFKIGDTIKVKGYEGMVDEISLSHTRLVDRKGTVIFMPNKLIISETIENFSMSKSKKMDFTFELRGQDKKSIEKTLEKLEKSIKNLSPESIQTSFSIEGLTENGVNIVLKLETAASDTSVLKREVWLLIRSNKGE